MGKRKQPEALRRYWASKGRKSSTKALTRTSGRTVTRHHYHKPKRHTRSRRSGGGDGSLTSTLVKVVIVGAGLGYLASDKTGPADSMRAKVRAFFVDTIPGGKTFGPAATIGVVALGVNHFLYKSKWLKWAGIIGLGVAAMKLGDQGTDFKWLGEPAGHEPDDYVADVE
jgi:hypothetical protein